MPKTIHDRFRNLEGKWSIKRTLGDIGKAEGEAAFLLLGSSNVMVYQEILEVTFHGNAPQTGHQEYKFIYNIERDTISKYNSFDNFVSDNFMYHLKFSGDKANGKYVCNSDVYSATYRFVDDNKFTLLYDVTGPGKNYYILTEFEKIIEQDVWGASLDLDSV